MLKQILFYLCFTLLAGSLAAQGWERVIDGSNQDDMYDLAVTPDGGYILCGYYNQLNAIRLVQVNERGEVRWDKRYFAGERAAGNAVIVTRDSAIVVAGFASSAATQRNVHVFKTDQYGRLLWSKTLTGISNFDDEAFDVVELADGTFALTGYAEDGNGKKDVWVARLSAKGDVIWSKIFAGTNPLSKEIGNALIALPNGDLVIAGERGINTTDVLILRIASSGNLIWEKTYDPSVGKDDLARAIVPTKDGQLALAGVTTEGAQSVGMLMKVDANGTANPIWTRTFPITDFYDVALTAKGGFFVTGVKAVGSTGSLDDLYVLHTDADGLRIWEKTIGRPGPDLGRAIVPAKDGGCVAVGYSYPTVDAVSPSTYLVKTDRNGVVFTSWLEGNVFRDFNANCAPNPGEPALKNWIVRIERRSDKNIIYAVSKSDGRFRFPVDTGWYDLKVFALQNYWVSCLPQIVARVDTFYKNVVVNIPLRSVNDCPRNEIDVATPVLRRCEDNVWTVRYCNSGTIPSLDTRVEVALDADLELKSSDIPAFDMGGGRYTFNVGTVNNGDCGSFTFKAYLNCAEERKGQTHCVETHIYPDAFCAVAAGWDSVIVATKAECVNGKVQLTILNEGNGDMGGTLGYVITEDVIMLTAPGDPAYQFRLKAGQDTVVFNQLANGKTYRIIADQSPGYPGPSNPTAAVEGCLTDTSTISPSLGYYTMFPEDDEAAAIQHDCQESEETDYTPILLKRGHPKGFDVPNYVYPNTDLEYLIQFRNTGTDTVEQVIVRDTLPASLDPSTVFPGAASHPYEFELFGSGIVQFTLSNLVLLPGNGSASEGFVKFRVKQKTNLPCRTEILNRAAVTFDFNQEQATNPVRYTAGCPLDSPYVTVKIDNIPWPNARLKAYPNPFRESVTFEIGNVAARQFALELYDIQGRLLSTSFFNQPIYRLHRHQIPTGLILYRLTADGKPVASGKLIATD